MNNLVKHKQDLLDKGFTIVDNIYSAEKVQQILRAINQADSSKETFRKTNDLFAIRQFLKEVPAAFELIFTEKLKSLISEMMGDHFFVVKSIYFDKPETSNWYVSFHQDLTISVDKKLALADFGPWTVKQNQFAVQPPMAILENINTVRIHLDDTDEHNGALKVIAKSHKKIYRPETINWNEEIATTCCVKQGGIMLMKPLILHSSSRTTNQQRRRVIHIEFSNQELPTGLNWAERKDLN